MKVAVQYLPLDQIAPAIPAPTPPKVAGNFWRLDLEHIEPHTGRLLQRVEVPLSEIGQSTNAFDKRNLLYSKLRPYLNKVYEPDSSGFATSELVPLRPDPSVIDRSYLAHLLRSPKFVSFASTAVAGAKMPRLSMDKLRAYKIPVPPLSEQRRIAATLNRVDALRQKHAEAQRLAGELVPAIFRNVFGHLPGAKTMLLRDISDISSGVAKGKRYPGEKVRQVQYMAVKNVQDGFIKTDEGKQMEVSERDIEATLLQKGDLLLTEGGDPDKLGRGAVWDGRIKECIHQNHIFRVRSKRDVVVPEYLSHYIRGPEAKAYFLRAAKQTTGIATINMTQLSALPVPLPAFKEQLDFLKKLGAARLFHEKLSLRAQRFEDLQQALAADSFGGCAD